MHPSATLKYRNMYRLLLICILPLTKLVTHAYGRDLVHSQSLEQPLHSMKRLRETSEELNKLIARAVSAKNHVDEHYRLIREMDDMEPHAVFVGVENQPDDTASPGSSAPVPEEHDATAPLQAPRMDDVEGFTFDTAGDPH
ncbi:hypothetical protein CYMTET_2589 [Cymbomonas tetramitiformis]|uniref:Uncharacterized protein n=1 Tax=Cymbomonas tetramitiformis TaxID=36881 RepID=A0AAE0H4N8_9CHLO|nr:hypothetical protein CYMTET_2773 [Cymbomonas tetramitiformis]KAK3289986.1 hypothetical protein CYMTET_2589 [Cymbomonas tetramitiformis]